MTSTPVRHTFLEYAQSLADYMTDSLPGTVAFVAVMMTIASMVVVVLLTGSQVDGKYIVSALILTAVCALTVVAVHLSNPSLDLLATPGGGEPGYIVLDGPGYWWWFLVVTLGAIAAAFLVTVITVQRKHFVVPLVLTIVFSVATVVCAFVIVLESDRAERAHTDAWRTMIKDEYGYVLDERLDFPDTAPDGAEVLAIDVPTVDSGRVDIYWDGSVIDVVTVDNADAITLSEVIAERGIHLAPEDAREIDEQDRGALDAPQPIARDVPAVDQAGDYISIDVSWDGTAVIVDEVG